jgi:hypothetical protein
MLIILVLSSVGFALATVSLMLSEATPQLLFIAGLMLFTSVASGCMFSEAYLRFHVARKILEEPSLYGASEVKGAVEDIEFLKDRPFYSFGLGVK